MPLETGFYADVPMDDYVRDNISPEPSVSTRIVQALVERSPKHAWQMHPRLGGGIEDESSRADLGSAVHSAILGGSQVVYAPDEFQDWRKKDAQAFRDDAREKGQIPLLAKQKDEVTAIAAAGKARLLEFGAGQPEQTMLWQDGGVWCRGRADFLTADGAYDIDVKTCNNADPSAWIRGIMCQGGYDVQAALRVRGHEILGGRTRDVLFLLVEIQPPYGVSVVGVGPNLIELAQKKVAHAVKIWRECLKSNVWPMYESKIHYAEPPAWMQWQVAERLGVAP